MTRPVTMDRRDGDVEHHALRLAAGRIDLIDRGGQRLGAPCGQRDLGALACEEARELAAETARSAGDENVLIVHVEHGSLPATCHCDRSGGVLWPLACFSSNNVATRRKASE